MSIHDEVSFDKEGKAVPLGGPRATFRKVFVPLLVLLVGLLGYGLGRLAGEGQRSPVEIKYDPNIISALSSSTPARAAADPQAAAPLASGEVYASSKGTKYYYPGCKSAISAANRITFASASMAEAAGYTLASGCRP